MANFKGFKQVSLAAYNGYSDEEKKNYLWLVRELSGETVLSSAIYFGTRKYADVSDNSAVEEKLNHLIENLADVIDVNGEFTGFLPEHELLSEAASLSELFEVLEGAILANTDEIGKKADKDYVDDELAKKADADDVQDKLDELEGKIEQTSAAVASGLTEDVEELKSDVEELESALADANTEIGKKADKSDLDNVSDKVDALEEISSAITEELAAKANADDVYTKDEVDAKVVGLFHFVDNADSINDAETVISVNGEDVAASEDNVGHVYQIGDAEYASNGSKWVKLGFNVDLSAYATKQEVKAKLDEIESGLTTTQEALLKEIDEREKLADAVEEVKEKSTLTAATFADAEELDLQLGQIVYITTDTTDSENSGVTYYAGAYIKTQDGLKKLDSTAPSSDATVEDRVSSLENRAAAHEESISDINDLLGNESLSGNTVTAAVASLLNDHVIEGDDVEE